MRCTSCGVENPPQAGYCLRCGNKLAIEQSSEPAPARQFVAAQAKSTMDKMLETPGTIVLAIGILLLLVSLVLISAGRWSGLGVAIVGVILLLVAVQLRGHETRIAASQAERAQSVLQNGIREIEVVKIKCRYCGALNPDGARNCGSCGAIL